MASVFLLTLPRRPVSFKQTTFCILYVVVQGFGAKGLGVITVSEVPNLLMLRQKVLLLGDKFAVILSNNLCCTILLSEQHSKHRTHIYLNSCFRRNSLTKSSRDMQTLLEALQMWAGAMVWRLFWMGNQTSIKAAFMPIHFTTDLPQTLTY